MFTICIPTFRGAERVAKAVASIEQQKSNFNILIWDDGSPEEDWNRLQQIPCQPSSPIRFFRAEQNRGVVASYNALLREVLTDDVLLLDDDAQLPLGFIHVAEQLLSIPNIGVLSWRSFGDQPGQSTVPKFGLLEPATQLAGYCMAFKRSLWNEVHGFDERFHHYCGDSDFALRAVLAGHPSYRVWWPLVPHDEHQAFVENNVLDRFHWVRTDLAAWEDKWSCDGVECERNALKRLVTP